MFAEFLVFASLQIGPFWQQTDNSMALCPFWSSETVEADGRHAEVDTTDVLWPVFTSHRDWWRFCLFTHYQEQQDGGWQFEIMPIWFNGKDVDDGSYWGLFPLLGHHPHILMLNDWDFCLWPLWMRYKTPRSQTRGEEGDAWMTSNVVLFPFFHWRDDGSWGVWPLCGVGHQRESDHYYALWPIATWASYRADRDTGGAGYSWMFWPLWASIERERESQWMFVPPFFGYAKTPFGSRIRAPWPFFELERTTAKRRISVFPLFEDVRLNRYSNGSSERGATRFGWKLVELYRGEDGRIEETRVFPFWTSGGSIFRVWPFWSSEKEDAAGEVVHTRVLELFPIRWVDAIDRNWAPYWTFYESRSNPICTDHSLFWGIIKWRTYAK
ncbi:MAG: hypothetical protein II946_01495 [Kiritimatiellae bacterium]|nr:hypothetical protein [Kiritimatiellia bacterium]